MLNVIIASLLACASADANPAPPPPEGRAVAVFAGGCFWCMEKPFEQLPGVDAVTSGYTGGAVASPTYKQVSSGTTGHVEAIRVVYDPSRVRYEQLLDVFWRNVDPLDAGGQFCDRGAHYRAAIFPIDDEQRRLAEASRVATQLRLGQALATRIEDPAPFWTAEAYHQDYYKTNPVRYGYYRNACGRDARLSAVWGDDAGR